jgi:heme iron utilization protein
MTDPTGNSGLNASPAAAVRVLLRQALKGALGTLDRENGGPYASLVTVATGSDGTPLMLLSRLAVHTQNLLADPRASLMIDGTSPQGDPLAGGRVSLMGRLTATQDPAHRQRFLARHPDAEMYAAFADFAFYALTIERAHYVGGFGRIVDLTACDVLIETSGAEGLIAAEADIVEHMNADHADAVALFASRLLGRQEAQGAWKMVGIDPEGLDLLGPNGSLRVTFPTAIATPGDARKVLASLAADARAALESKSGE